MENAYAAQLLLIPKTMTKVDEDAGCPSQDPCSPFYQSGLSVVTPFLGQLETNELQD